MQQANTRKHFNLYLDGIGYAGTVKSFTPPNLSLQEEDLRTGGMDAPIKLDMGMEALTAEFTLQGPTLEALRLWGKTVNTVPLLVKGSIQDREGVVTPEVFRLRGNIAGLEHAEVTPGGESSVTLRMSVREYEYQLGGVVVHSIDILNMVRIVNGEDQLASHRAAIGL